MAITKFKLSFESKQPDINLIKFQKSLPSTFKVYEKNEGIFIDVETETEEDNNAKYLVERELNRHFFMTCVKITAEMVKKIKTLKAESRCRIQCDLPDDISPQKWNYELPLMLKSWVLAADLQDEFILKILYYFQIIELAYPLKSSYPKYTDPSLSPDPLTECKLIRNWVAHAGKVDSEQLKKYCIHLGIRKVMFDPADISHQSILSSKIKLLEEEAKKAINKYL